jgi:hypothetical protein
LCGFAVGLAPMFAFNALHFGSPLRTGYHYWCSVPYDYPTLTFSPRYLTGGADGWRSGNLARYLAPQSPVAEVRPIERIVQAAFWLLALAGIGGALANPASRRWTTLVLGAALLTTDFYSFYFFYDLRFLLPVYVAIIPYAVVAIERLLGFPAALARSPAFGLLCMLMVAAVMWLLGPRWLRPSQGWPRTLASARSELADAADRLLPDDAHLISNLDGAFVSHDLLRGTRRQYLPLDRGVEYASKRIQPRRPERLEPPPDRNPFAHRSIQAAGSQEAFPTTAMEVVDQLEQQVRQGAVFYLLLEHPLDATAHREMAASRDQLRRRLRLELVSGTRLWEVWRTAGVVEK